MSTLATDRNIYATQFSEIVDRLPGRGLDWLQRLRKNAIERFDQLGFPTTRLEEWKYTNVAPLGRLTFRPALKQSKAAVPDSLHSQLDLFSGPRLVFVNGMLDGDLSLTKDNDCGLQLNSLGESLGNSNQSSRLEGYLGRYADASNHAFVAWNTGFFGDGAYVVIPAGTTVAAPIHLVFVSTGADGPVAAYPRNLIVAGEGARVALVETFLSPPGAVHLTNAVTEIVAGANATIDYYKIQRESTESFHVATLTASLDRDASLTSHTFSFGAVLTRNDLNVALNGEGSQCTLDGLFLVDGHRLVDNHTVIDHRRPHGTSRELYKGILSGYAQGVFNGAIVVRKDAQKTDAVQHSKNLLLSEHAQINTKPQLEIRADDVRCAHGASIGQLDREAMFYLRTRGVDDRAARRILIRGFAAEILDRTRVPDIRRQLEVLLDEWFEERLEAA
jgi:Fe-S cluster assembly protein SufD